MIRFHRTLLLVLLSAAVPGHAAGLPDTGQDTCYNDTVADGVLASSRDSIARDIGTHPRQDCRYGRDAAAIAGMLPKTGAGAKGFDYTKIANNGNTLPASTALGTANTAWACTRDNITGLTWEVKTATSTDLRYSGHSYSWYSTAAGTNGGDTGSVGTDTCGATLLNGQCNTEAYIAAVNAAQLCNAFDWRLPTRRELHTLVNADGSSPSIAPVYFPNTPPSIFWSGSSVPTFPSYAWYVSFGGGAVSFTLGRVGADLKAYGYYVRLVRGGQF